MNPMSSIAVLLAACYGLLSAVLLLLYAWDKRAARSGRRRTRERTLHLLALAGGWPGALLAQRLLGHKSSKRPFLRVFWLTVVGNGALLTWLLLSPSGARLLRGAVRLLS